MDLLKSIQEIIKQPQAPQATSPQASTNAQQQNTATTAAATTYADTSATTASISLNSSVDDSSIYTQSETPTMNGFENTKGLSKEEINEKDQAWRDEKEAMGLQTTNINYDRGETTFAEYFAALDPEVQEMLTSYFEDGAANKAEAEQAINEIAGIFQNTNVVKTQTFVNAVRALGYDVEWGSVKTDYIIDFKNQKAGGGNLREDGTITMLTIKNKDGEELFKMVDANGNGSIEMEELFFNEFLTGISSEIDKELMVAGLKAIQSVGGDASVDSLTASEAANGNSNNSDDTNSSDSKKETISISKLRQLLDQKTSAGKSVELAAAEIKTTYELDEKSEKFIKDYKARNKDENEKDTDAIAQEKENIEETLVEEEELELAA